VRFFALHGGIPAKRGSEEGVEGFRSDDFSTAQTLPKNLPGILATFSGLSINTIPRHEKS
jgi:hypothetical protein